MKVCDLARLTGYSNSTIRNLAAAGQIPGAKRTAGGHFRFKDTEKLRNWLMQNGKTTGMLGFQCSYRPILEELVQWFKNEGMPASMKANIRKDLTPLIEVLVSKGLLSSEFVGAVEAWQKKEADNREYFGQEDVARLFIEVTESPDDETARNRLRSRATH